MELFSVPNRESPVSQLKNGNGPRWSPLPIPSIFAKRRRADARYPLLFPLKAWLLASSAQRPLVLHPPQPAPWLFFPLRLC